MKLDNSIIKHYLKNVLFINGTAYAGKSTMVEMLGDKYGLIQCGENYHSKVANEIIIPSRQPNLCYFQTMKDWQEFINRAPEDYEKWIIGVENEVSELEVAELISLSQNHKVIVDTNIPVETLKEIADYNQVVIMLSPQSMSVENFFDRDDEDKAFLKEQIMQAQDPQKTMENFKSCIARVNSKERYDTFANSGFLTIERTDLDTKADTVEIIAKHFRLKKKYKK